ncbi:MAG TPA: hypothetical protein V6C97_05880 [Oculatellaceae cyanobacterium]
MCFLAPGDAATSPDEVAALQDFANALTYTGWTSNNLWMSGDPCNDDCTGRWFGVQCGGSAPNCHITSIQLGKNQLSGQLPASIGKLSYLTGLVLENDDAIYKFPNNLISGPLPASITNLTSLA